MALPTDTLRDAIDSSNEQEVACDKSIADTDAQIAELQKKQDGIQNGYCTPISQELFTYLEGLSPGNYLAVGTTNLFNDSIDANGIGNLTDWAVLQKQISTPLFIRVSDTVMTMVGDQTSRFTGITKCAFGQTSGSTINDRSEYSSFTSAYDMLSNITTVTCSLPIITITRNSMFYGEVRKYNTPVDSTVTEKVDKWEFGHDYICKEIGVDGTYGTKDMMLKLQTAKTITESNKAKVVESRTKFADYASPE